jgi:hypothetical protein
MCEGKSWQAKHVIRPHHYMQIKPWLTGINWTYGCFCFTMCKYLFSWENTGKIGNLWNFDMWSQILTGKKRDTTTPLYGNQTFTHRHQLAICIFFGSPCLGIFLSWENTGKTGNLCHFAMWSHMLIGTTRDTSTTTPYENPPLTQRHQ